MLIWVNIISNLTSLLYRYNWSTFRGKANTPRYTTAVFIEKYRHWLSRKCFVCHRKQRVWTGRKPIKNQDIIEDIIMSVVAVSWKTVLFFRSQTIIIQCAVMATGSFLKWPAIISRKGRIKDYYHYYYSHHYHYHDQQTIIDVNVFHFII